MSQAHQPRVADVVAESLRRDILSGRFREGEILDVSAGLLPQFAVSLPALREGIRVLENDGLLRTVRGSRGGVVVQLPTPQRIGEVIAMVLQARQTDASDVSRVLARMEPICAAMCAERGDRGKTLVPALRAIVARQEAEVDDLDAYMPNARAFHDGIVAHCGSKTMVVALGALEAIWAAHATSKYVHREVRPSEFEDRRAALDSHRRILEAIEQGDGERAASLLRTHIDEIDSYYPVARPQQVDADLMPKRH